MKNAKGCFGSDVVGSGAKHTQSHDSGGYAPMVMARDVMSEA